MLVMDYDNGYNGHFLLVMDYDNGFNGHFLLAMDYDNGYNGLNGLIMFENGWELWIMMMEYDDIVWSWIMIMVAE